MLDQSYFVYMLQSTSRRALYIGFTDLLVRRTLEHRTARHPGSFSDKYKTWRLVYYEEYGDADAAKSRERQLKGWSRAKKEALIVKMNPRWRDLISEWEEKYGLEFRVDDVVLKRALDQGEQNQPQNQNKGSFDSGFPRPPH